MSDVIAGKYWGRALILGIAVMMACRSAPDVEEPTDFGEVEHREIEAAERVIAAVEEATRGTKPKRIILFIGDGMGVSTVSAASYASGAPLAMMSMSEFGLLTTHEYEFLTTDSAASATAIATGQKTHFEGVSVRPNTSIAQEQDEAHQLRTVAEAAQEAGWKTGLVATSRITHATPAPFGAHRHGRHQYEDIALDLSRAGFDLLLGAGSDFFNDRDDGRNLFMEMSEAGYEIAAEADEVRSAMWDASRLIGLMHPRDMPWAATDEREMELDEMVEFSLEFLSKDDPAGFFLMVEGSFIDWAGHALDGQRMIEETLDMDRGVMRALEYARDRRDTLVVVTSDHETGAMNIIDGPTADRYLEQLSGEDAARSATIPDDIEEDVRDGLTGPFAHFKLGDKTVFGPVEAEDNRLTTSFGFMSAASRAFWDGQGRFSAIHTPEMVPLFAEGPGADSVASIRDSADLGRRMIGWIDGVEPELESVARRARVQSRGMPKNVILLVGDGLGVSSLTASYYHYGASAMLSMRRAALVATHGSDRLVNDSAASATALATGHRTRAGVVGLAPSAVGGELQSVPSVLVEAIKAGRKTGVVTTTSITDATPAAFYAATSSRREEDAIARQLVELHEQSAGKSGVDFIAGGGAGYFDRRRRKRLKRQGYTIHEQWAPPVAGEPNLYLLAENGMDHGKDRHEGSRQPTLEMMTDSAIDSLDGGDQGFFLMVEGGQIDWAKHSLDRGELLMAEMSDFEDAVGRALDFANDDGETLVLVTSDHDHTMTILDNHYGFHRGACGAVSDCGGNFELDWLDVAADKIWHGDGLSDSDLRGDVGAPQIALQYDWMVQEASRHNEDLRGPHSANFVPLFAQGPGALEFGGFMDQPEVGRWLVGWAKLDPTGEPSTMSGGRGTPPREEMHD